MYHNLRENYGHNSRNIRRLLGGSHLILFMHIRLSDMMLSENICYRFDNI